MWKYQIGLKVSIASQTDYSELIWLHLSQVNQGTKSSVPRLLLKSELSYTDLKLP